MRVFEPVRPGGRFGFNNVRPYFVPDTLDELTGPVSGTVTLPNTVSWGPVAEYDLTSRSWTLTLYETVITDASGTDDFVFLNDTTLREVWDDLNLPDWLRSVWESSFAELR